MNQTCSYEVLYNGVPYSIEINGVVSDPSQNFEYTASPGISSGLPAQAPWVTARRIAHLPAR